MSKTPLAVIQKALKAPKSQYNSFGKYKYRNCEDILEAVKPLLSDADVFYITDEIIEVGNRIYVEATATFNEISVTGYAREAESKKGMDDAQVTGATSSYARKYALNALFAIDDTKDADSQQPPKQAATKKQLPMSKVGDVAKWLASKGKQPVDAKSSYEMTDAVYNALVTAFDKL